MIILPDEGETAVAQEDAGPVLRPLKFLQRWHPLFLRYLDKSTGPRDRIIAEPRRNSECRYA